MITFITNSPHQLLSALRNSIRKGEIETWSEVEGYLTHSAVQWNRKAWFLPSIEGNELRFAIIKSKGSNVSREVYAIYHGRFIEMMLAHFDNQYEKAAATALATVAD
jgi:hypothetical protein